MQSLPKYDMLIIDPTSAETIGGTYRYLPMFLAACYRRRGYRVQHIDDATYQNLLYVRQAIKQRQDSYKEIIIGYWSEPQTEICHVAHGILPTACFVGYEPFIKREGLPIRTTDLPNVFNYSSAELTEGMMYCSDLFDECHIAATCELDMHLFLPPLRQSFTYPIFTSYGCPRGCSFCSMSVNHNRQRTELPLAMISNMLRRYWRKGYTDIHFLDEDALIHPTRFAEVLRQMIWIEREAHNSGSGKHWFAFILASVGSLENFLCKVPNGGQLLKEAGVRLVKIGLESADDQLAQKMGKAKTISERAAALSDKCPVPIFWLTIAFFPGETIGTLNSTGRFMSKYGIPVKKLGGAGKIHMNGTEGGLGQFFQPIVGTPGYEDVKSQGRTTTARPMRLVPSFIPYSLLNDKVQAVHATEENKKRLQFWCANHGVGILELDAMEALVGLGLNDFGDVMRACYVPTSRETGSLRNRNAIVAGAVAARLNIIQGGSGGQHTDQHSN